LTTAAPTCRSIKFAGRAVVLNYLPLLAERFDATLRHRCDRRRDACPVYPGRRYVDWVLDDPAGLGVEQVRPVRDEIERRVRGLLVELEVPARA
jgi:protein-tyrosine-phosphatase